ncbi:unnamed protein product [Umbelopsis ramanniana]
MNVSNTANRNVIWMVVTETSTPSAYPALPDLHPPKVRKKKKKNTLAISLFHKVDYLVLELIQNKCLRMIFGGQQSSSTEAFRHMCDLPSWRNVLRPLCLISASTSITSRLTASSTSSTLSPTTN